MSWLRKDLRKFLMVRQWRILDSADANGLLMWFDPSCEKPLLVESTPPTGDEPDLRPLLAEAMDLEGRGGVRPPEGSDSEEVPGGVQKLIQLDLF